MHCTIICFIYVCVSIEGYRRLHQFFFFPSHNNNNYIYGMWRQKTQQKAHSSTNHCQFYSTLNKGSKVTPKII